MHWMIGYITQNAFIPVFVDYCVLFKGMLSLIMHVCIIINS